MTKSYWSTMSKYTDSSQRGSLPPSVHTLVCFLIVAAWPSTVNFTYLQHSSSNGLAATAAAFAGVGVLTSAATHGSWRWPEATGNPRAASTWHCSVPAGKNCGRSNKCPWLLVLPTFQSSTSRSFARAGGSPISG